MIIATLFALCVPIQASPLELRTASTHPMRYYVALPEGWSQQRSWPVVVAIESADREFKRNAQDFAGARGHAPFILVVPEVVTNGGPHFKDAPGYDYQADDWARVEREGPWGFDEAGLASVLADVRRLFHGEGKYYLTGWEAGAHTVFALTFSHPEAIWAAAPVCPNYAGRNVTFSRWPGRGSVPIRVFAGSADPAWGPGKPLTVQSARAKSEGEAHGFKFEQQMVPGKGHGSLSAEVLKWFDEVRRT